MMVTDDALTILVVDDERDIREGCQRILERRGYKVILAENGQAGLDILNRERVALTLLDIKMPGLDGLEALRIIQQDHPQVLVIIITGFATVETAIKAMKLGAYDFIPKPFQPDQLRLIVDRAIERKKLIEETERLKDERQRTLLDLDTEKSRTRTIIRTLPHGVAVTTPDGRVVLMNPAFRRLIGLDPMCSAGKHISAYIQNEGLCNLLIKVSNGGGGVPSDTQTYELALGDDRFLLAQCNQVLSEEGDCLGAVLVVTDVTEWKILDRLRTDFLAKVSHELRSPLSTIDLQLGLLLGGAGPDQDKHDRLLLRAKERTQGLIFLIRDLLDISRIELDADRQSLTKVHLDNILRQVVESLMPQAVGRKHTLSLELPDNPLPPLIADASSLESVFNNLVANAINYTPDGGSIGVKACCQNNKWLMVEVSDNGFGIAPEQQKAVFDKFYRVKNEKTRYIVGTGLGLSIVKVVVDRLGGRITLDSEEGRGSTFTVLLPLVSESV